MKKVKSNQKKKKSAIQLVLRGKTDWITAWETLDLASLLTEKAKADEAADHLLMNHESLSVCSQLGLQMPGGFVLPSENGLVCGHSPHTTASSQSP